MQEEQTKRRWQFSIRDVLLLIVIAGLTVGWSWIITGWPKSCTVSGFDTISIRFKVLSIDMMPS